MARLPKKPEETDAVAKLSAQPEEPLKMSADEFDVPAKQAPLKMSASEFESPVSKFAQKPMDIPEPTPIADPEKPSVWGAIARSVPSLLAAGVQAKIGTKVEPRAKSYSMLHRASLTNFVLNQTSATEKARVAAQRAQQAK